MANISGYLLILLRSIFNTNLAQFCLIENFFPPCLFKGSRNENDFQKIGSYLIWFSHAFLDLAFPLSPAKILIKRESVTEPGWFYQGLLCDSATCSTRSNSGLEDYHQTSEWNSILLFSSSFLMGYPASLHTLYFSVAY